MGPGALPRWRLRSAVAGPRACLEESASGRAYECVCLLALVNTSAPMSRPGCFLQVPAPFVTFPKLSVSFQTHLSGGGPQLEPPRRSVPPNQCLSLAHACGVCVWGGGCRITPVRPAESGWRGQMQRTDLRPLALPAWHLRSLAHQCVSSLRRPWRCSPRLWSMGWST